MRTDSNRAMRIRPQLQLRQLRLGTTRMHTLLGQQVMHGVVVELEHAELHRSAVAQRVRRGGAEEEVQRAGDDPRAVCGALQRVGLAGGLLHPSVGLPCTFSRLLSTI